ncbi:amino acid ABC transporter substrate-binding protein [Tatumella citrea]|uniref:Amino acid ABC transporter substrate-binding protein n=1 Tax=Tatumella citrea TaxID=53336 RepID=A0A1Y0L4K9_TATCI|nr:amino acid ABC transporter substrate-binding protein [Tatumella citrea]ARU92951.1 amino acid ABC transporter substrate-binding protein [Tatumella citrea]ARU96990.1 amino acid ABC transporter substrate-binding protein [Tatumella citrea]
MRSYLFSLLVFAIPLGFISNGYAQDDLTKIKSDGVFKVGTEGTFPPFTYHDASGKLVGFDVDIAREIAKRIGVKAEFVEGRWDGLVAGLDANRYDAVINQVSITPERKAKYDFSEPYIAPKIVLIVNKNNTGIHAFSDLKGKKTALTLTSSFALDARKLGSDVVGTDGFDQSIALVIQGRADATINSNLSFLDFKKHEPDAPVKVVAEKTNAEQEAVLIRKNNPELRKEINSAIEDIKNDGTYQRISIKYFGVDVSK